MYRYHYVPCLVPTWLVRYGVRIDNVNYNLIIRKVPKNLLTLADAWERIRSKLTCRLRLQRLTKYLPHLEHLKSVGSRDFDLPPFLKFKRGQNLKNWKNIIFLRQNLQYSTRNYVSNLFQFFFKYIGMHTLTETWVLHTFSHTCSCILVVYSYCIGHTVEKSRTCSCLCCTFCFCWPFHPSPCSSFLSPSSCSCSSSPSSTILSSGHYDHHFYPCSSFLSPSSCSGSSSPS